MMFFHYGSDEIKYLWDRLTITTEFRIFHHSFLLLIHYSLQ